MNIDFTAYNIDTLWLNSVPAPRTLLVVYAHHDDESFGKPASP